MMASQELIAAIRRFFYVEHWNLGPIASELNLHPDTVKRALETERFRSCQSKLLPTDPFLDFIEQTLKQHPRLRATRRRVIIGINDGPPPPPTLSPQTEVRSRTQGYDAAPVH